MIAEQVPTIQHPGLEMLRIPRCGAVRGVAHLILGVLNKYKYVYNLKGTEFMR